MFCAIGIQSEDCIVNAVELVKGLNLIFGPKVEIAVRDRLEFSN